MQKQQINLISASKTSAMKLSQRRQINLSSISTGSEKLKRAESRSSERNISYDRKMLKINSVQIETPSPSSFLRKRKSLGDSVKISKFQSKQINFSHIKNKQHKSNFSKYRMLIQKSKSLSKNQKQFLQKKHRLVNQNYFGEDSYRNIHKRFLRTLQKTSSLKQNNYMSQTQSVQLDNDQRSLSDTHRNIQLPNKSPQYFKKRIASIKNKPNFNTLDSISSFNQENSLILTKKHTLQHKDNQFLDSFESIALKVSNQQQQQPSTIIYNHFSNKYRDYHNIRKKQMGENKKNNEKLHKQQSKILYNLKKKGISEQIQLKLVSHFYQTELLMAGHKPLDENTLLRQKINATKNKKKPK